ncbi:MAG TPA: hypothetical protein VGJ91_01770 [Polyangiaceae bacterium]
MPVKHGLGLSGSARLRALAEFLCVACAGLAFAVGCSSDSAHPAGGAGSVGSSGSAGIPDTSDDGGNGELGGRPGLAGSSGLAGSAGGVTVPVNPLCPKTGPIVAGTDPLPDGVEIVAAASAVRDLIVANGYVYWTTEKTILRAPVGGGSVTTLLDRSTATARSIIGWLQVDGDTLYFTEVGPDQVAKMPADGSAGPTTIATGNSPWQLVLSGGMIYYYEAGLGGQIDRVPVAGGTPTPLVLNASPSKRMVVANGYLYFIDPATNGSDVHLLRVALDAPPATPIDGMTTPIGAEDVVATDNYNTNGVVADATSLYWDEGGKLMKAPQAAGAKSTALDELPMHSGFASPETTYVGSVVVDSGSLYWNSDLGCSDIFTASTDGSGKKTLVHQVAGFAYLSVDATHLYFWTGTQILRAPR